MWLARDKDGTLYLYRGKPSRTGIQWNNHLGELFIDEEDKEFPEVKWEDEEPTEVELIIKQKK